MDQRSRLQVVDELPEPITPVQAPADPMVNLGAQALMIGIGALSKRFLVALASLWLGFFTISTVFSAWWLWYAVRPQTVSEIVALATYAVFITVVNIIVRRA